MNATPSTQQVPATRATKGYDPLAPVGSAVGLKGLLESQKNGISVALPKHVTPERLIKTLLVAANRIPDLLQCTQASILETINRAAELGLDLSGTLGEAYPVPFNNKVKVGGQDVWVKQCQLIIGYRGLEKLAWQSNELEHIDSEVVCANDTFVFKKGTEVIVEWSPAKGDRGEAIGVYACAKFKSGGKLARFLTVADVEKIRNASKSKDSPAWKNWWDEMARAKAIKRMLKDAPLSTEKFVAVLEHEDPSDINLSDVQTVERMTQGGPISDGRKQFGMRAPQQQQTEPITQEPVHQEQQQQQSAPQQQTNEQVDTNTGEVETPEGTVTEPVVGQQADEHQPQGESDAGAGQDQQQEQQQPPLGERPIDKMTQMSSIDAVVDAAITLVPPTIKLTPLAVKQQIILAAGAAWAKVTAGKREEVLNLLKQGTFPWKATGATAAAK